jgi:hypothetical protein
MKGDKNSAAPWLGKLQANPSEKHAQFQLPKLIAGIFEMEGWGVFPG